MSSELLAGFSAPTANPANQPGGGTNYATSGARNNETNGPNDGLFTGGCAHRHADQQLSRGKRWRREPERALPDQLGWQHIDFAINKLAPAIGLPM